MKILMLGWELPPHNSGGLGVACFNLAKALSREGADIDFVVPYTAEHPTADFMHVLSATTLDPIHRYGGGAYASLQLFDDIIPVKNETNVAKPQNTTNATNVAKPQTEHLSIRDVQKIYCDYTADYLKAHRPDIAHAHDWLTYEAGIIAKQQHGVPLVAHVHATEFDRAGMRTGNPLIHEIEREGLMLADRIIAVSESTKRIIHDKYHIPLSKIDVVYNSLDENYQKGSYALDSSTYKYIEQLKTAGFRVVSTVGRFTIQKGLPNLMRAAQLAISKNPKLIFIFAGDGEERNDLISLSAEYGIAKNVIFTGFVRGRKLRDIYSLSDIFVMSSISEPFGLTALEAAHHGDVLILTHQSGVSEIIWSALKYDFWDQQKLADEILAVAASPALQDTLRTHVQQEYDQISWDKVAKKCLKVYNKTTNHKRNQ